MSENHERKTHPHTYAAASNSEYITAEELSARDAWNLTCKEVELRILEDDKGGLKKRNIVWFKEASRGWVTNKTNDICLEAMFGPDPQDCVGKIITLITVEVMVGGEKMKGIRVKGSPDLERDKTIRIKLHKRKAFNWKLEKTGSTPTGRVPDEVKDETIDDAPPPITDDDANRMREPGED